MAWLTYSPRLRNWGFNASLSPSPTRLMASTVSNMATPGITLIQGASRSMVREAPIMKPQLIRSRSLNPRTDRADSVRMDVAIINAEIGKETWRERVGPYGEISGEA